MNRCALETVVHGILDPSASITILGLGAVHDFTPVKVHFA